MSSQIRLVVSRLELEKIQFWPGHASVQTTERYRVAFNRVSVGSWS